LLVSGSRKGAFDVPDLDMLTALGRQAAVALDNAFQHERASNFFTHASDILVSFLETLDVHHPGHSRGTAALADLITRRLALPDPERRRIHFAALLHDIGKVRIDPVLLRGVLLPAEARRIMREHARLGAEMLKPITAWAELPSIILSHHERWDGTGYPAGLAGEDIPLGARIVAVAEVFDAMRRETPYSRAKTEAEAIAELEACAGTQFDPKIVRLFVAGLRDSGDPRVAGEE
jgi:putative nucleotidyltransferase with HDIG domain